MSLVRFLLILAVGTVLSWAAWVLVLMTMSPADGGTIAILLFYGSGWLAIFGTAAIIGFFLRYWFERETVLFRQIAIALRHGTIVSTAVSLTLFLQSRRALNLWAILAILALAIVVELFFLAGQTQPRTRQASPELHTPSS